MQTNQALANEALRKLMNAIAAEDGIRVSFEQDLKQAHATIDRVVHMPPPSAVDAEEYWFLAYHELGHLLKPMRWSYTKLGNYLNPKDELVLTISNIIMDNLCEESFHGHYEGVDSILDSGRTKMVRKDWYALDPTRIAEIEENPVHSLIIGLIIEDFTQRQTWMGHEIEALSLDKFEEAFMPIRESLRDIQYAKRVAQILQHPRPEIPCSELVLDILAIIEYDPPPPEGDPNGDGEGEGEGEPEDCEACGGTGEQQDADGCTEPCESCGGTGKEPGEGGEQGQGKGKGKEGEGDGESQEDKHVGATDDYSMSEADSNHSTDGIGSGHAEAHGAKWKHDDLKDVNIKEVLNAIDKNLTKAITDPREKRERRDRWSYDPECPYVPWAENEILELEKDVVNFRPHVRQSIVHALGNSTVSKQVSKYLKAMVTESYTYGQKRGKIHQKNVHKLINKPIPGVQPGIFKRKNNSVLKTDSAVTLLIDCSGSMSGSKYATAAACVVAISETLTGIGVTHEIIGFTEDDSLVSFIFKNHNTTFTKDKLISVMANCKVRMYNNADGESLHYAAQRLAARKESHKLLIVLSDGYPAGCYQGDGNAYLKKVCKMIEEESKINLVGIGIKSDAVSRFYKHHVVVNRSDELDGVLFNVLKEFLI